MTSTQKERDLRIVLLGKSGSGKSATGNTILGREAFEAVDFIHSATKLCEKHEGKVGGKTVSVIDTPGLFNTAVTKQQLKAEIEKCVEMSSPGPHVFLLVLKLGVGFTKEERDAVKCIQENFGKEALSRTIILFTHTDQLKGKPVDDYINKSNNLMEIIGSYGGRYHSFNNEERKSQEQVTELMNRIDALMEENEINHYTLEMFKTTQKMKEREMVKTACIAVLGFGLLGKAKIAGVIAIAISGRAAGSAVETTAECAVAATGEAVDIVIAVIEKAVGSAGEAAQTKAGSAGVAVAGSALVAAAAAGAARAAAVAGKVATSGRVSVVAAVAAAFGGTAVTLISALKP